VTTLAESRELFDNRLQPDPVNTEIRVKTHRNEGTFAANDEGTTRVNASR
jgi:hypothetical protein